MSEPYPTSETAVAEVLDRYPATAGIFLRHRMACVGCELSPFETIADAAANYDLPLTDLLLELRAAAEQLPLPPSRHLP